ncbi:hypothetical protein G7070_01430 [Propioniciclava coleopterorum]|uniref:Uncharacterized protein n=1 Tax=Propioniciclava coleopterorum TaxID=2714937 RepID=A0A6G7Y307_9ACTN|nr:hypothetical protein [Propioniciclava coleopterorum]QIK71192.1 hypothetical protein G7070_01430 [Propioniciclava coleopterorum]
MRMWVRAGFLLVATLLLAGSGCRATLLLPIAWPCALPWVCWGYTAFLGVLLLTRAVTGWPAVALAALSGIPAGIGLSRVGYVADVAGMALWGTGVVLAIAVPVSLAVFPARRRNCVGAALSCVPLLTAFLLNPYAAHASWPAWTAMALLMGMVFGLARLTVSGVRRLADRPGSVSAAAALACPIAALATVMAVATWWLGFALKVGSVL